MRMLRTCGVAALALAATPAAGPAQVTFGQTDTFQSGSLLGWSQGVNAPAGGLTLAAGGPAGAADSFMRITATGGIGAGSRLIAFNDAQWTGNYPAAGVNTVEMDLWAPATNLQALSFRVALKDISGSGYVSGPVSVPNDATWRHAVFQLTTANMTPVGSPGAFDTFMTGVTEMRVLHANAASLNGDSINAAAGVDNVHAGFTPVPEPAGVLAVGAAGAGVCLVRGRRRRIAPSGA